MAPRVVVIGGGISGLAAAHHVMEISREKNIPVEVQVLEASRRPGGIITTREEGSFLLEEGPESFITDKPWALALCKRLGLDDQIITTNPARKSHVLWDDKLHQIPDGFNLMAPGKMLAVLKSSLFSIDGKARIAMERLMPPKKDTEDESIASFVRRRLGAEALERLVQPLVGAIYGGDVNELSLLATFPRFADMEQKHGSMAAAMKSPEKPLDIDGVSGARYSLFVTLKSGMGTLISALFQSLPEGSVLADASVQSLQRVGSRWEIVLDTGYHLQADAVIVTLPAPKAAKLLRPIDASVADTLAGIRCAPSANVHLAYPWTGIAKAPEGFGFVVPSTAKKVLLGCTFSSAKFPGRAPKDTALLRAFVNPDFLEMDDEELVEKVKSELALILGISQEPLFVHLKRHAQAMPQYTVGHVNRVAAVDWRIKTIPRLALAGNAFHGVGLPDCVRSAEAAADLAMVKLQTPG